MGLLLIVLCGMKGQERSDDAEYTIERENSCEQCINDWRIVDSNFVDHHAEQ